MPTKCNGQNGCEIDPPELSKAERIDMAVQAWHDANGALSSAKKHGVNYSSARNRCKGAVSKKEANQAKQRLSVAVEERHGGRSYGRRRAIRGLPYTFSGTVKSQWGGDLV